MVGILYLLVKWKKKLCEEEKKKKMKGSQTHPFITASSAPS